MRLAWGRQELELELGRARLVEARRGPMPPPLADLAAATESALAEPFQFPQLRRALTPEDHVVVVLDPMLAHPEHLLPPLLRHITEARVDPSAITLLCPVAEQSQAWIELLPEAFQEIRVETHQPDDPKKLAYLATTQGGRRVYLNRSAVDADQTIVVTRRFYDGHLGYAGGPGVVFPGLADEEALTESRAKVSMKVPGSKTFTMKHEAEEITWLMGAPFFLQVVEGEAGEPIHVVAGTLEACHEAERRLDAAWHVQLDEPSDLVVATLIGDPASHTFDDMARAVAYATRAVKPGGRVVLVCDADPELGPACQILREMEEPRAAKKRLFEEAPVDLEAGFLWTTAAERAKLYVFSQMSPDTIEEMYATPLDKATQVGKLIAAAETVAYLPDAHRTWATLKRD